MSAYHLPVPSLPGASGQLAPVAGHHSTLCTGTVHSEHWHSALRTLAHWHSAHTASGACVPLGPGDTKCVLGLWFSGACVALGPVDLCALRVCVSQVPLGSLGFRVLWVFVTLYLCASGFYDLSHASLPVLLCQCLTSCASATMGLCHTGCVRLLQKLTRQSSDISYSEQLSG